jgi:hypothetical protein
MPSSTSTLGSNGRDIRVFVNILKTTNLIFSDYTIENTDTVIEFKKQVDIAFGREASTEKIIPKKMVDKLILSLYTEARTQTRIPDDYYPIKSLWSNGLEKTHTFYVSNVYQLIGNRKTIPAPFSHIFWTFKFGDKPDKATFVDLDQEMTGGNNEFEAFAQVYKKPTKRNRIPDNLVVPQSEYCSDILTDFLKSGKTVETIVGALQTYSEYQYSIIDSLLLEQLVIDYKNAVGDTEITLPKSWNNSIQVSTKESLEFNAFACAYNGALVRGLTPSDLEELLEKYTKDFEKLANMDIEEAAKSYIDEYNSSITIFSPFYNSQKTRVYEDQSQFSVGTASPFSQFSRESSPERLSPLSSPYYNKNRNARRQSFGIVTTPIRSQSPDYSIMKAGQRVPVENLYMDLTKSFVRRGGSSPKSDVK